MKHVLMTVFSTLLLANTPLPVPHVDPKSFSGLWYEVARTYNEYEKDCVAATVEYALQEDNTYRIHNRCFEHVIGGDLIEYKGTAKPAHGDSMSKIDMTYFYIFTTEYRVIHLEEDYSAAVVADEEMEQVWVMSRKPELPKSTLDKILAKLETKMDLQRLIFTPQDKEGRYK
jgi:apolipoprotein D and lipocalin family protein